MLVSGLNIGYLEKDFSEGGEQKFVISEYPTTSGRLHLFNFYGINLWPNSKEEPRHEKIVQGFELRPKDVLGGGRVRRSSPSEIMLYGVSSTYGGVPREFLDFFKNDILRLYRKEFPEINSIVIDTPEKTENDTKVSFLEQLMKV